MSTPCIVVGDDDRHVLNFVELLLRRDYQVIRAANGKQILEMVKLNRPSMVLVDSRMPEMSGLETLAALRSDPETCDLPIFLMSSDRTPVFRRQVLSAGASGFLAKPFTAKGLRALLSRKADPEGRVVQRASVSVHSAEDMLRRRDA